MSFLQVILNMILYIIKKIKREKKDRNYFVFYSNSSGRIIINGPMIIPLA